MEFNFIEQSQEDGGCGEDVVGVVGLGWLGKGKGKGNKIKPAMQIILPMTFVDLFPLLFSVPFLPFSYL